MNIFAKSIFFSQLKTNTLGMRYLTYLNPNNISVQVADKLTHEKIKLFQASCTGDLRELIPMFSEDVAQLFK